MGTVKHSHKCWDCATRTECFGQLEDNWDGWPEIVCVEYRNTPEDFRCESCQEKYDAQAKADLAENVPDDDLIERLRA